MFDRGEVALLGGVKVGGLSVSASCWARVCQVCANFNRSTEIILDVDKSPLSNNWLASI